MSKQNDERRGWYGGSWVTDLRRLALYLRDGLACVWCLASVGDEGVRLSLDHVRPNLAGGGSGNRNLITCCSRCNSSRKARTVVEFATVIARRLADDTTAGQVVARVRCAVRRKVRTEQARELIAARKIK